MRCDETRERQKGVESSRENMFSVGAGGQTIEVRQPIYWSEVGLLPCGLIVIVSSQRIVRSGLGGVFGKRLQLSGRRVENRRNQISAKPNGTLVRCRWKRHYKIGPANHEQRGHLGWRSWRQHRPVENVQTGV